MVTLLNFVVLLLFFGAARNPIHAEEFIEPEAIEHVYRDANRRVVSRWIEDDDGYPLLCQTYEYDGELIVETLWGNLSGECEASLIIDKEGQPERNEIETYTTHYLYHNGHLEAQYEQNGRTVHYTYLPNSDLIETATVTTERGSHHVIYHYDDDGNLIYREYDENEHGLLPEFPTFESFSHAAYVIGRTVARSSGRAVVNGVNQIYDLLNFDHFGPTMFENPLVGESFFILTGSLPEEHHCGVVGYGEVHDKVRVTHINGILNGTNQILKTAQMISDFHGGVNIHYTHNSTDGFTWDLIGALAVRVGAVTLQARHLARTWKDLIAEMGGTEGGGQIYHYAHSLGGADTAAALTLMEPDEKAMISIYTFGSPTMVSPKGLRDCKNYVSRRDGVGLFGVLIDGWENVTWVGSAYGIPFIDHFIRDDTYREVIKAHGEEFEADFGMALAL